MALPERLAAELRKRPAERVVVGLLREALDPVLVRTVLPPQWDDIEHLIIVRRTPGLMPDPETQKPLTDHARLRIAAYAFGPDATRDAQDLALLIEQALQEGDGNRYSNEAGTLVNVHVTQSASGTPGWDDGEADWATLPSPAARYAATYQVVTRLPGTTI